MQVCRRNVCYRFQNLLALNRKGWYDLDEKAQNPQRVVNLIEEERVVIILNNIEIFRQQQVELTNYKI